MNKTLSLAIILLLTFSSFIVPHAVFAEKNIEDVQKERKDIKKDLTKTEAKVADILIEIKDINEEIEEYNETLKANEKAINEVEEEISIVEEEIEELELKIEERFDILKERAQSYQTNGGNIAYLEVLFGAKDFNEFISRLTAISRITDSDAKLIEEQERDKEIIEKKLEQLEGLKEELKTIEANIMEQKEATIDKKKELEDKQEELDKVVSKLELKDKKLASIESKIIAESAAPISGGSLAVQTVDGGGALGWPTVGGYISSHVGERWGRMHKGIDIARTDRSTNPPIFAAGDGTVETANFNGGGYGNMVIINHGNGLKTLYGHMSSLTVSSGQSISRGQQIGVMGQTGNSKGVHLHFEVHVNGSIQNPVNYLK